MSSYVVSGLYKVSKQASGACRHQPYFLGRKKKEEKKKGKKEKRKQMKRREKGEKRKKKEKKRTASRTIMPTQLEILNAPIPYEILLLASIKF